MNDFDRYLKSKLKSENTEVPDSVKVRIEETLAALPQRDSSAKKRRVLPRVAAVAACFVFTLLFLLPNISITYAEAIENVPIIGKIVNVVTVRNYLYADKYHEMDIDVPEVSGQNSQAADYINKSVSELTDALVKQFYSDLEATGDEGHSSVYVNYETVTNTEKWFTLKIKVHEAAGSSNTYFKYYHINKQSGKTVNLGDLAADESFYRVAEEEIKRQMQAQMELDKNKTYWLDDSLFGEDFVSITPEHNFYLNPSGDIVIPFDKYEVAPGYMGTPEFTVSKDIILEHIRPQFRDIFS